MLFDWQLTFNINGSQETVIYNQLKKKKLYFTLNKILLSKFLLKSN